MNKIIIAFCSLLSVSCFAAIQPNVIVIMADDLGYEDLGFQGSKVVKTPHDVLYWKKLEGKAIRFDGRCDANHFGAAQSLQFADADFDDSTARGGEGSCGVV